MYCYNFAVECHKSNKLTEAQKWTEESFELGRYEDCVPSHVQVAIYTPEVIN